METTDIREARRILNLSQEDLARKLDVSARTIGNWESGERKASGAKLEKIQKLLNEKAKGGDVIEVGDDSPGAGKGNNVNSDSVMLRALEEIAAQRKLTENALTELSASQQQVKELIGLLKLKIVNP